MALRHAFTGETIELEKEQTKSGGLFASFKNKSVIIEEPSFQITNESELIKPKKRRKRKVEDSGKNVEDLEEREIAEILTGNTPIIESYVEVNNLIRDSIAQTNQLQMELKSEWDAVRGSRIKGRYTILTDLATVMSSLSSTKLSAIKELESIITTANKMEISRVKDLKIDNNTDDNMAIMGLYENIVNTPRNTLEQGFIPRQELASADFPMLMVQPGDSYNIVPQLAPSETFTPEQNRMIVEANPDIKTVVVYDRRTEDRYFKMMDMTTGEYIEGVAVPDPFLLEGVTFNFATMTARNANTNMNFPLVVIGEPNGNNDMMGGIRHNVDNFGGNF